MRIGIGIEFHSLGAVYEYDLSNKKERDLGTANAPLTDDRSVRLWVSATGFSKFVIYEGCSNMNASGFITFFTYMLRQNGKRFYKGLYVTFKVAPDQEKNTVYLSSYSPLN